MLPFFSFILMWIGSLNWFFISAFQYDFIAGFFGTQSSLFSRFIYFFIGMAGFVLLFHLLKNKGKFSFFEGFKPKSKATTKATPPVQVVAPDDDEDEIFVPESSTQPKFQGEPKAQSGYKDFDVTKYD
jgi:uncharacterized membrane protein YuzA (DUF378 family)